MRQLICFAVVVCVHLLFAAPDVAQDATSPLLGGPQVTFTCSNCGKDVPGDAKKCPHCGTEFADELYVPPPELLAPTAPTPEQLAVRQQQPGVAPQAPGVPPAAPLVPATGSAGEASVPFTQSMPFKIGIFAVTALILLRWFFRN